MIHLMIKIVCLIGLLVAAGIVLIHILPWIIGILAVYGLVKLYKALTRPKYLPPARPYAMKRAPLTSWEEYAQALLQANETSFVN